MINLNNEVLMEHKYNRHNRRKYSLKVHIVLVTKYRKQLLVDDIAEDVKQKTFDICNSNEYKILAMETDKEYIHLLLSYDATDRFCDIVKTIKQETNFYLKKNTKSIFQSNIRRKRYFGRMDILLVA